MGVADNYRDTSFVIPSGVALYGGFDGTESSLEERDWKANETILSGDIDQDDGVHPDDGNAYQVIYFYNTGDQTRLDGFTIMRGYAVSGLYFNTFGGGIRNTSNGPGRKSNPAIVNCKIEGNRAANFGGGVYNYSTNEGLSSPVFINCVFSGNRAGKNGGGLYSYGINGGNSNPRLINCSFASNRAEILGGGMYHYQNGSPSLTNCILWGNQADNAEALVEHELVNNSENNIRYSHCNIRGSDAWLTHPGQPDQVMDSDPLFVSPPYVRWSPLTGGNLRLKEGSPCLDADVNDSVRVAYDLGREDRIQNGTVEMGAYEGYEPVQQIYVHHEATGLNNGSSWGNAFRDLQDALDKASPKDTIWVAEGTYYPSKRTDLDESGYAGPREATFHIPNDVKFFGGFEGTEIFLYQRDVRTHETILNGDIGIQGDASDNAWHVVCFINAGDRTVLDGFTITGGNAVPTADGLPQEYGAGIYNFSSGEGNTSSPAIRNCLIQGNKAEVGGGMFNKGVDHGISNPILMNCIFRANDAAVAGGGMYNLSMENGKSSPTLINCVFSGNATQYHGGGLHNFSKSGGSNNPRLVNCTFSGNYAGSKGGALINRVHTGGSCQPVLTNCILWGDQAGQSGNEVYNQDASPNFTYCDIEGGSDAFGSEGTNNITYRNNLNHDPLFIVSTDPAHAPTTEGNLHLGEGSYCIDAGINDSVTVAADADGEERIQNGTVDMGAYESTASGKIPDGIVAPKANGLKVYPNPTNGLMKIELNDDSEMDMLKVIDITGTEVVSRKINESIFYLDLSSYPGGVYLIRAVSNGEVATMRIIKY